jgi:ABC-type uncharacterized transport system ATPase subunit
LHARPTQLLTAWGLFFAGQLCFYGIHVISAVDEDKTASAGMVRVFKKTHATQRHGVLQSPMSMDVQPQRGVFQNLMFIDCTATVFHQ